MLLANLAVPQRVSRAALGALGRGGSLVLDLEPARPYRRARLLGVLRRQGRRRRARAGARGRRGGRRRTRQRCRPGPRAARRWRISAARTSTSSRRRSRSAIRSAASASPRTSRGPVAFLLSDAARLDHRPDASSSTAATRSSRRMLQFHHTGMTVSSLERALAFWGDALGASRHAAGPAGRLLRGDRRRARRGRAHGAARVRRRGPRIELFEFRSPGGGRSRPGLPTSASRTCASAATTSRASSRACSRPEAGRCRRPRRRGHGVNAGGRAVYVRDPDGHTVELFSPAGA